MRPARSFSLRYTSCKEPKGTRFPFYVLIHHYYCWPRVTTSRHCSLTLSLSLTCAPHSINLLLLLRLRSGAKCPLLIRPSDPLSSYSSSSIMGLPEHSVKMCLVLLATLLWAVSVTAQAPNTVPAFSSNSSSYQPSTNNTEQLVLGLPVNPSGPNDPSIFALTDQAYKAVPRDSSTLQGVGDHLWDTNPSSSKNISDPIHAIAFISCDSAAYTGNIGLSQVLDDAITANVSAVLFYSINQNFCQLNSTLTPSESTFGLYYSMVSVADSQRVLASLNGMLSGHAGAAEIMTAAAYTNVMNTSQNQQGINSTPSTAVAMIILYSITGVITALFLVIIVTGAVRAHRHPERYGPQNVLGRPRQSRAKGIARAMLDTIPIVKFGERQPPKPNDVELAAERSDTAAASRDINQQGNAAGREKRADSESRDVHEGGQAADSAPAGASSSAEAATAEGAPTEEENVSCSICTEDFEKGQDIRVLPCDHKFHPACVDPWLLDVSGTCPLCRVDLRPQDQRKSGEEQGEQEQREERRSREGEPLPPPLNEGQNRRRDTIRNFLDPRRMQGSNQEERISALRRWRQATRRSHVPEGNEQNAGSSSGGGGGQ